MDTPLSPPQGTPGGNPNIQDWVLVVMMMGMETHQPHDDGGFDALLFSHGTQGTPRDPTPWVPPILMPG